MLITKCQKEVPTPALAEPQAAGCTNVCASGYNQKPFPDCSCYLPPSLDTDFDGIPDSEDPDDDNDGFSDDEEIEAGTDPLDPTDYPGAGITYTCGQGTDKDYCLGTCPASHPECVELEFGDSWACACIDDVTETVHPSWKPDGIYHNPTPMNGEPPDEGFCFDNDFHLGFPAKLREASSCEDSSGTYYDYCDGDLVHDWFCDGNICSDALAQSCESYVPDSDCIDGACIGIGTFCGDLGYDRHWDTSLSGNCEPAARNYCGEDSYEFHYYTKHLWCCYKCI